MMHTVSKVLVLMVSLTIAGAAAETPAPAPAPTSLDQVLGRILSQETDLAKTMRKYYPLVETYIQDMRPDRELGAVPKSDHYFIGRMNLSGGVDERSLMPAPGLPTRTLKFFTHFYAIEYLPGGFAQMMLLDETSFDRAHYDFEYVRREFLGEVRTLVFDVKPKKGSGTGRFLGRIWAEDQDYHIVRFNGTYSPAPSFRHYFHFDSWRVNMGPGLWLPAYVYTEESDFRYFFTRTLRFKGQTRIWGYDVKTAGQQGEFTKVLVDAPNPIKDQSETPADLAPVRSLRAWERLAEDNVLQRLEKAGLMASEGEVDKVLTTVINNIEVTNNIDVQPEVRARVLLTTPLESFTVGHTVVISRGLLDVLPDEASLAMVLSHELAHILLGHRLDTKFAFDDRMLFADEQTFRCFNFAHDAKDEAAADQRALALLQNSPYKDKTAAGGLFLRALSARSAELPALIRPHMGSRMAEGKGTLRMGQLMTSAPQLEMTKKEQIAALPLGGRVKVDPWSSRIMLLKNKPVALLTAGEKMPFEVTPFLPYLTRQSTTDQVAATVAENKSGAEAATTEQAQSTPPADPAKANGGGESGAATPTEPKPAPGAPPTPQQPQSPKLQ